MSSWPSHVDSPEPLVTMEEARTRCGPEGTVVGVIGSPIAHSLSPVLHNAAFAALGLTEWRSFAFDVPAGAASRALEDMRRFDVLGLSVTMPHKADVAAVVDACEDVARRLQAVNCILNRDGILTGTNTDGQGFVEALARGVEFDPAGRRCLVVGAGGAARAVILALAEAGAAEVAVLNRTEARAVEAATLAGSAGVVVSGDIAKTLARVDLVVNATPVGMTGTQEADTWPLAPELLRAGQVAADLVYVPRPTAWLERAADRGAIPFDGLGMLVHQAAAQLVLWTGRQAPLEAMWLAAEAAFPSSE
jgi:shikimate dehydrogenase